VAVLPVLVLVLVLVLGLVLELLVLTQVHVRREWSLIVIYQLRYVAEIEQRRPTALRTAWGEPRECYRI
jgi:hypothetical protein